MPFRRAALAALILAALAGQTRPCAAIEITPVRSPGGLEAWLVEDHKNPIVTIRVDFGIGSSSDPPGRPGVAHMVSNLLDEGAGTLRSADFRKALEDNSILLFANADADSFAITLTTLTETRETAFELLRLALSEPRFDPESVERVRNRLIAAYRSRQTDPGWIAGRVWWKTAFAGHPYGEPGRGRPATLRAISRDDLAAFAAGAFTRDRLVIGAVGDIAPDELAGVLDQVFGRLPASGAAPDIPYGAMATSGETRIVEQDIPQSVVVFGHDGIDRDHPDWYAAIILFEVLAGGFGSRLQREIREKRGLTYAVSAWPTPLDHADVILGSVSTVNERVAETIGLIRLIWAEFGAQGPTADEVRDAKDYINGSYGLGFTNSGAIAGALTAIQSQALGLDYIERRPRIIEAVGVETLKRVARRLFRPDELFFVIVGKPAGLTATVPASNPDN